MISQAGRSKVNFPIKATTAEGDAFQFTNVGEPQALLDAIQTHRQTARDRDYDCLKIIDSLTDPQQIADFDFSMGWPIVIE